jgi:hypothetical protein
MTNFLHKLADKVSGNGSSHSKKSAVVEPSATVAPGSTVGGLESSSQQQQQQEQQSAGSSAQQTSPGSFGASKSLGGQQDRTTSSTTSDFASASRPGTEERFKYDPSKGAAISGATTGSSSTTGLTGAGSTSAPSTSAASTSAPTSSVGDDTSARRTSTNTSVAEGVSGRAGGLLGGVDEKHFDASTTSTSGNTTGISGSSSSSSTSSDARRVEEALKGGGERVRHEAEPIVREHVHDEYMHVHRTRYILLLASRFYTPCMFAVAISAAVLYQTITSLR